jgi:CDP-diacylglycerol--glycerol-3-phosphate 3-phosphatidyltransferase
MNSSDPFVSTWVATLIFAVAAITDWLDGFLARKLNATTMMGKLMDPIADKVLVSAVLLYLIPLNRVEPLLVLIILSRDLIVGGIRQVAAAENIIIAAKASGKTKTALQMFCLPMMFFVQPVWGIPVYDIGYWGLWLSVGLSVTSGWDYTWSYLRHRMQELH